MATSSGLPARPFSTHQPTHPRLAGRPFKQYLCGDRIYSCSQCRTHAADHNDMVSKAFQGRHGRAYLFSNV